MKKIYTSWAFTLIELVVSITIFSMIIVSVLAIFLFSSQMATRVELNRMMQENLKNVLENISEGVRKEGIVGVRDYWNPNCPVFWSPWNKDTVSKNILCLEGEEYALWYKLANGSFLPVSDPVTGCQKIDDICYILKKETGWDFYPLSNSFVAFQEIQFTLSNDILPKLTISIKTRPAYKKGLASDLLENNSISIQTTLSERLIQTQ